MGFPTQLSYMRVKISEVNMGENFVSGTDTYGKSYRMMVDFHGPVATVPQVGEIWLIERRGNDWSLNSRLENGDEQTPLGDLNAGDRRLEANNDLWLNGSRIMINGVDITTISQEIAQETSDRIAADTVLESEIDSILATPQLTKVEQSGVTVGIRHAINLIPGANITLGLADNPGSDRVDITITGNVQTPSGVITAFAGSASPTGWALCDGSAISRATNAALFAAIGTTYGTGDGSTTFNIPDLQGRMIVGKGPNADVSTLGANEGFTAANRTMKHYHGKGTIAIAASGAHGHTFTGTLATITGGAHGHTFTGSAVTSSTESQTHTHGTGTLSAGTDSQGSHSHGGSTSSGNAHSHGYQFSDYSASAVLGGTGGTYAGTSHTLQTDVLPAHSHTISSDGAHTHNVTLSGSTGNASVTHTHSVTAAGTISNTDTHTHSYTPQGTLSSTDTHVHSTADFTGNVGTTTGVPETPAYIVLNYIIKL